MSETIIHELACLLELLWYCILIFLPVLVAFGIESSPSVIGSCFVLSYHLMHIFTPCQLCWVYAITGCTWWLWSAYRKYLDTVQNLHGRPVITFKGWCALTTLTALAQVDVLKPPKVKPSEFSNHGYLPTLLERPGRRPAVERAVPTEQLNQRASRAMFYETKTLLGAYAATHPEHLQIKRSYLEPENEALCWDIGRRPAGAIHQREEWGGEIAHVHGVDGSVHVVLHPEDIAVVIEAGWGERHPLCANDKRWFRLLFHGFMEQRLPVPEGLVLVYAPRDEGELQVLDAILEAAVWYATRGELPPVRFGAEHPRTENQNSARSGGEPRWRQCCMSPRNCTALPPPSGSCVCTCSCAAAEEWAAATNELQLITLPEADLALLNPDRVWSTPESVTPWGADPETSSPPPPFEPLSFPGYAWPGYASFGQTRFTSDEHRTFDRDDVKQQQGSCSSKFSLGPDSGRSLGGPPASPPSCSDVSEEEAISPSAGASGGLHPGSAEGHFAALAVGHHWSQNQEQGEQKGEVTMAGEDDFTEDDFF